jgi:hypothetical protein
MADVLQIPMTPQQYVAARAALSSASSVSQNTVLSTTTGSVKSNQIDFTYSYDGGSMLTLTILARHGLEAKLASDDQIKSHIMKLLA